MSETADWIEAKARTALAPGPVENTLTGLRDHWPAEAPALRALVEQFPLGEASLLHLISVSSICATRL
ncbi:MAG: hypothetical protein ABI883_05920, partial [Chthoniobacterales bacterium]